MSEKVVLEAIRDVMNGGKHVDSTALVGARMGPQTTQGTDRGTGSVIRTTDGDSYMLIVFRMD